MTQKHVNSRFVQKHDIEANWIIAGNAANPFIPLEGEIIVYDADDKHGAQRFKIGDGKTKITELPFRTDVIDVTKLPDVGEEHLLYRLLSVKMVVDRTIQPNATCYLVDMLPTIGTSFITLVNESTLDYITTGYYNKKEDKLYCYVDEATKNTLKIIVDKIDTLTDLEKLAAKTAITFMTTGWKDADEVLKIIGTVRGDLSYGGVVTSLDAAVGNNILYVYLTSELY